jgi:hypothetical protein
MLMMFTNILVRTAVELNQYKSCYMHLLVYLLVYLSITSCKDPGFARVKLAVSILIEQ